MTDGGPTMPYVDGVTHRFVDAGNLRVHVAEAGAGEPLVLLHTVFEHWFAWRHVIPVLAERFHVVAVDLRSCGWTDAPSDGYEKEQLADDVVAALDALGIERAPVMGHSLGGLVGFLIALRHPARVDRLVAIGVLPPWVSLGDVVPRLHRSWYQAVAASPLIGPWVIGRRPWLTRWVLKGTSPMPGAWPDEVLAAYTDRLADPARARAVAGMYRTLLARELAPILRGRYRSQRLHPPTLLLMGTEDYFFSTSRLGRFSRFADYLEVRVLTGAGHFVAEERPALLLDHALPFLQPGHG